MRAVISAALPWAAPVATMAVLSIAISFTFPLFALLLERMGVTGMMVGLNHTLAAIAMVVSAPILPGIMARVGAVPLALSAIAVMALATASIPMFENYWWWGCLRIALGFSITSLFYVSEYWLVAQAPDSSRGRIVAIYTVVLSGSYMVGPVLLAWLGPDSVLTFAIPVTVILAGAIPVLVARRKAPEPDGADAKPPLAMLRFLWTDPMVMWGVVLFGVIEFGAMGLIANWGIRSGYDESTAVQFVFWLAAGSMALQLPIGWLADRLDRRYLLTAAGLVAVVMPLLIVAISDAFWGVAAAIFLWGGMAVGMYTLALVELGARYSGTALAEANAAVVLCYGLGALFAPLLLGLAMDIVPPDGALYFAAVCAVAYLGLAAVRLRIPRAEP
ncbi:MAG: MFS transporter [Pseudomonadota bacterium]